MTKLVVDRHDGTFTECHAVYLGRSVALTAAHCVATSPASISVSLGGEPPIDVNTPHRADGDLRWSTGGADIYYHPQAFARNVSRYGEGPVRGLRSGFDLAIIKLPKPMSIPIAPVFVYQPADPPEDLFEGVQATVGGHDGGASSVALLGLRREQRGTDKMLVSDRDGSIAKLRAGDSGGGVVVELAPDLPPSRPFADPCAPPIPAPGDPILVGISQRFQETDGRGGLDYFVPAYTAGIVEWITSHLRDEDGCEAIGDAGVTGAEQGGCAPPSAGP